jgi:diketogulonate reductase-like aldo/keto reductase
VRLLGVSNVSTEQLGALCAEASVAPALVQNRCYARTGWDREVRALCRERGVLYQAFSLLTANRRELDGPIVEAIARRLGATVPQVVFGFAGALGMIGLTGTTDPGHMRDALASLRIELTGADVVALESIGA